MIHATTTIRTAVATATTARRDATVMGMGRIDGADTWRGS